MRGATIVEAVLALALGAGGGTGFLFATGDLKTPTEVQAMQAEKSAVDAQIQAHADEAHRREELVRTAEAAKAAAVERAREAALAAAKAQAAAQATAQTQQPTETAAKDEPKFGRLTLRALSGDLDVDGGGSLTGHGRAVELSFDDKPGKIKVRSGKFSVVLMPKPGKRDLGMDVSVSPMALITADGNRVGTSAENLQISKKPYKLDFQSPVAGDLNLLLSFKK